MPTGARGATTRVRIRVCTAEVDGGHGHNCTRPVPDDAPVPLCLVHALLAAQWVATAHPEFTKRALGTEPSAVRGRPILKIGRASVVYYLRFGELIKIGTSTNLPNRLESVPHDEVLAIEPGGNATERRRHAEFASTRHHREWFTPSDKLLDHIAHMRFEHGEPLEAWERMTRQKQGA